MVLNSHTHYPPRTYPDYDPRNGILYSSSDINGVLNGRVNDLHIGSFFIPNPFGITFFAGIERDPSVKYDGPVFWNAINPFTEDSQSIIDNRDNNKFNLQVIDPDRPKIFEHSLNYASSKVTLAYFPYAAIEEHNASLKDILLQEGLSSLMHGTILEAHFRNNNLGCVLDVARHTKEFMRDLRGYD
jgi:hypothetical protein